MRVPSVDVDACLYQLLAHLQVAAPARLAEGGEVGAGVERVVLFELARRDSARLGGQCNLDLVFLASSHGGKGITIVERREGGKKRTRKTAMYPWVHSHKCTDDSSVAAGPVGAVIRLD